MGFVLLGMVGSGWAGDCTASVLIAYIERRNLRSK